MSMPQRRPGPGMGTPGTAGTPGAPGRSDTAELLDRLVKEGRITAAQAAQYRGWEAARPAIDAGRDRFDAWMARRPQLPGMPPVAPPSAMSGRPLWREADSPAIPPQKPRPVTVFPTQDAVLKTVDRFERENKITEAQAELVRRWEKKRPGTAISGESFDAWMKLRPDVPGLTEFWG